ncbi:hypothetical protein [Hoeflea prorocentri]|uniref:Uncharacterized protein n=1 Tax=Hoeflea prorocentri TaxID=1922333 RepID=A0A9X3ZFY4_9HYPH|nr:hypothetical protein [Hoeflea prorocentri]MCY6379184.1 hypothetical protein [Hoeflea prorocentri]MDA5396985.1 hypothetical protein [Hoeflea prorocentri]
MSGNNVKSSAIAAALILAAVAILFLVMPRIVLALGEISPWLGYAVTVLFVLGFFAIFWLRARHQRRNRTDDTV